VLWLATLHSPAVDDWRTKVLPGGFSVDAPCALALQKRGKGDAGDGWVGSYENAAFVATLTPFAAKDLEGLTLDRLLVGVLSTGSQEVGTANLLPPEEIVFNGWPGTEPEIGTKQRVGRLRAFCAGKYIFEGLVEWESANPSLLRHRGSSNRCWSQKRLE